MLKENMFVCRDNLLSQKNKYKAVGNVVMSVEDAEECRDHEVSNPNFESWFESLTSRLTKYDICWNNLNFQVNINILAQQ